MEYNNKFYHGRYSEGGKEFIITIIELYLIIKMDNGRSDSQNTNQYFILFLHKHTRMYVNNSVICKQNIIQFVKYVNKGSRHIIVYSISNTQIQS